MAGQEDGWLMRRIMRMTWLEKRHVNSPTHAEGTMHRAHALLGMASLPAEPRCLEVGCGQGAVTRVLVENFGAEVIATDYDPQQVELAKERLADLPTSRIQFRQADARSLPFDDSSFDVVVEFGVWHHLPGHWREAAAEVARVLKPGGIFAFSDGVLSPTIGRLMRALLRIDEVAEDTLCDELVKHGLNLQRYQLAGGFFLGFKSREGFAVKGD